MKTCPTCQATYPDTIAFCSRDGAELRASGAWEPGTVVRGRYQILSKIGEGGMGAVYKAKHTGFDELRAIKVLNPQLAHDARFHDRFKREAYITRKLQHPNAVRVDDIDESEDGCPFMVMEYIEGKSLKQVMLESGALPAARVCAITKQVASALESAHRLGMIHRDIKPENIVLVQSREGEKAKVLDFGIARIREGEKTDAAKGTELTGGGFVVGTPMYISPEQAQGMRGDELDGRSDLYSLGIVMYQMLTGTVPFKADDPIDLLIAHIQRPPRPIRLMRPDLPIPESLASLVMRLLEKDRALRSSSATALIADLQRIEKGMPISLSNATAAAPGQMHGSISPSARVAPAAPRAIYGEDPSGADYAGESARPQFFRRLAVIIALCLLVAAGVWYRMRTSPAQEIARHQAAAEDFERRHLLPQAEEEYLDAIQIDASNAALQSAYGHVLVEERKWDDAITALRAAIAMQPDNAVAHNNLGVALETAGNVADAIHEFREAVRVQPDYLEGHSNLGQALEKQSDLNGSITEFREVLRLKPDDANAHFHLGLAYYKQGNTDNAVDEYREAIRIQPGFALAHYGLGGVLFNRGDHDAGIEELRTAYALAPDDPEIRAAYQKLLEK